jgi:hypothetical protein
MKQVMERIARRERNKKAATAKHESAKQRGFFYGAKRLAQINVLIS